MVSSPFRSPAPGQLLDAVRAVFEHSGFVVSQGFDRPVGTDYVVHPSGQASERCAVACFAESAAADAVSHVADAAHRAGIRHVQVITTAPIPEDTIRTAQSARVALTDAMGFEAAVQALPEEVRLRLGTGQAPVPPPPPSYTNVLYGSGPVPISVSTPEGSARKGPSLAFLVTMGVLLMVGVAVSIHSITSQMRLRQDRAMRAARDLVQVAGNAKTAGHDFVEMTPEKTAKAVAESISRGATISDEASPLYGVTFSAGQMTAKQVEDAIPYLALERGELVYKSPEPKPAVKAAPPAPRPAVAAESTTRPASLTPPVLQRTFATLPISSSTPTWKSQCQRPITEFYREVWSLESITEHEALMFAGAQVDYHSSPPQDPQHPMSPETASRMLSHYGSQYPQLTIASARYLDPETYPELAEAVLEQLSNDPNFPILEWQVRSQIAVIRRTEEDVTKAMEALHLMLDHTQGLKSVPDYLAANLLMESEFGVFIFAMEHERIAGVVWDHPLTPAWLKEFIIGHHHIHAVSEFGRHVAGNTVTPSQELEVRGHLSRGLAALNASWEENPNIPETAAAMITLSDSALKPRAESRQWFERAVRLRADCAAAYDNWLAVAKSDANVLRDFGDACFASKRFDTGIPQYYFDVHYVRSLLETDPAPYWANLPEEDTARMDEMFSRWKADVNRTTNRDYDLTVEAIYHLKRRDARRLLETAAGLEQLDGTALRRYDMTLEKFKAEAGELRRGESTTKGRVHTSPAKQVPVP